MVTNSQPLRVVFFGTPAFAVPTLDALIRSPYPVAGVVTQPDRPRGRGHKTNDAPVKALALSAGIPVLQPARLKDPGFVAAFRALNADVAVVAAYGRILTDEVLGVPAKGFLNVHASLLPRHRGAAPVHRAVIAGDAETGITIMQVVRALDAGPMLAHVSRPIGAAETSVDVERDLARLGAGLLVTTLDAMAAGRVDAVPQDETRATYAPKLTKQDGILDWHSPAERIHNLIRGLHPWPHAVAFLRGTRLILLRSRWSPQQAGEEPGTIVEAARDHLAVAAGSGIVELTELQPEGRRPMTTRDFLAGHPVSPGDRFEVAGGP
jgi:methionyl-tRNA formyltransferase